MGWHRLFSDADLMFCSTNYQNWNVNNNLYLYNTLMQQNTPKLNWSVIKSTTTSTEVCLWGNIANIMVLMESQNMTTI